MRVLRVAVVLFMVGFAGCNDKASAEPESIVPEDAFDDVDVEATSETGVIKGIVIDEAVRPLEGVEVVLRGAGADGVSTSTKASGVFAFDGLQAGTYFIRAAKVGYREVQHSVDVVAGVKSPPVAKIMMQADPGTLPFLEEFKLDGFMQCGGVLVAVTFSSACTSAIGDEDARGASYTVDGNITWMQSEMVWDKNTALADRFALDYGHSWVMSQSPIVMMVPAEGLGSLAEEGGETDFIVWPMGAEGSDVGGLWGVGLVLQQEFQVFTFFFHNYQPPADWTFINDGPAPMP